MIRDQAEESRVRNALADIIPNITGRVLERTLRCMAPEAWEYRNEHGETYPHLAVKGLKPDVLEVFVNRGVRFDIKDSWGLTPLGRARNMVVLLENGYYRASEPERQDMKKKLLIMISFLESETRKDLLMRTGMEVMLAKLSRVRDRIKGKAPAAQDRLNKVLL